LQNYPTGKLVCCHDNKRCKWYQSNGGTKTYIPKSNRSLAEKLAAKKYLSCVLEELLQEKKALDSYLKHHNITPSKSKAMLTDFPDYSDLLASHFKASSQHIQDWMNTPYEQNTKFPEHLIHKTISGQFVRSKSESLIASSLHANHIPFRYECALYLGRTPLYPDFTILHPQTEEIFYWEHFGMMDDPSYGKNAVSKLQTYISHGFIPSIHLITTYETAQNPLSTEIVQKTIEHYFL